MVISNIPSDVGIKFNMQILTIPTNSVQSNVYKKKLQNSDSLRFFEYVQQI